MDQGQHRIPEVYLKKFGYNHEGKWYISVLNKHNGIVTNEEISNFSKSKNEFDFPFVDLEDKRLIENNFAKIENRYNTAINILESQKKIIPKYKELLVYFVSRLICGSELNRYYFDELYLTPETQTKFLQEITMFEEEESAEIVSITSLLKPLDIEYINAIRWLLMNFLNKVFSSFNMVFISCQNNYWLTSDNPVVINRQNNYNWIIPIESEILLPLSKELCLFMYHDESEFRDNKLRNLAPDRVHDISLDKYEELYEILFTYNSEYIIFPHKVNEGKLMDM